MTATHKLTLQSISADTQALMQEAGLQISSLNVLERFANLVPQCRAHQLEQMH